MVPAKALLEKWSTHPFPRIDSRRELLGASSFFALGGYILLVVFQPFGTYTYSNPFKYLLLLPYALILFLVFITVHLVWHNSAKEWTLFKEIGRIAVIILVSSGLNYCYNVLCINYSDFSFKGFLYMILYTFLLTTPISIMYFLRKHTPLSPRRQLDAAHEVKPNDSGTLTLHPHTGSTVDYDKGSVLYVKSEGNYCRICYDQEGSIRTELLRISLNEIENLTFGTSIRRCHRSYLVNTERIQNVVGNAQGYKLTLFQCKDRVPVSRKYTPVLKKFKD